VPPPQQPQQRSEPHQSSGPDVRVFNKDELDIPSFLRRSRANGR